MLDKTVIFANNASFSAFIVAILTFFGILSLSVPNVGPYLGAGFPLAHPALCFFTVRPSAKARATPTRCGTPRTGRTTVP